MLYPYSMLLYLCCIKLQPSFSPILIFLCSKTVDVYKCVSQFHRSYSIPAIYNSQKYHGDLKCEIFRIVGLGFHNSVLHKAFDLLHNREICLQILNGLLCQNFTGSCELISSFAVHVTRHDMTYPAMLNPVEWKIN